MSPVGFLLDSYNSLLNLTHPFSISFKVNSQKPCSDHALEGANICPGTVLPREWSPRSSRCYPRTQEPALIFFSSVTSAVPKCLVLQPSLGRCSSYPPLCFAQAAFLLAYSSTPPIPSFSLLLETPLLHSLATGCPSPALPQSFAPLWSSWWSLLQLHIDFPRKRNPWRYYFYTYNLWVGRVSESMPEFCLSDSGNS